MSDLNDILKGAPRKALPKKKTPAKKLANENKRLTSWADWKKMFQRHATEAALARLKGEAES